MRACFFLPVFPALVVLTGCATDAVHRGNSKASPPVPVQTATVAMQDWPAAYEATGTVRARLMATISSKVMGYAQQVSVQAGDHVREGQPLVTLDTRDLDASVRRAEAGRAEVESALPELENAANAAKANLELAQATFRRMEELAAKKSISNQEFDEASARVKSAQAAFDMALSRRKQVDSRLAVAEEEIRAARIMRDYARIVAPFAGRVNARNVEPGNLAAPGVPLLTIEQDGAFRLEASMDESKLATVRLGQAVDVTIDSIGGRWNARVAEIAPSVDAASRTYMVKLDLPPAAGLRSGMFGRATFPLGTEKVVAIPCGALVERGQLQSVFVVEDGVARARMVTTGRRSNDAVEVLSGLNASERIVAVLTAGLRDGAAVEVRQ